MEPNETLDQVCEECWTEFTVTLKSLDPSIPTNPMAPPKAKEPRLLKHCPFCGELLNPPWI